VLNCTFAEDELANVEAENLKESLYAKWRSHSAKVRHGLQVSANYSPRTKRTPKPMLKGLASTERVVDLINVAWAERLKESPSLTDAEKKSGYFANVSQAVQRRPWGRMGTLCTSGIFYSYEHDLVLSGYHMCRLHGVPMGTGISSVFSSHQLRDLAGESFSLPCITTAVLPYYCNPWAPWWKA
jgi:hypothetical protein